MALRTGGLASRNSVRNAGIKIKVESEEVTGLRKSIKEQVTEIESLKGRVEELKQDESTTALAFKAFSAGPQAFEREIKKEWEADIQQGKLSKAKNSLYGGPTDVSGLDNVSEVSRAETEELKADEVKAEEEASADAKPEVISGYEVAMVEEIVLDEFELDAEELARLQKQACIVEFPLEEQAIEERTTEKSNVENLSDEVGQVAQLIKKFKKMEMDLMAAGSNMNRAQLRQKSNQIADEKAEAERKERNEQLEKIKQQRIEQEQLLLKQAAEVQTNFAEKWPYGEPHKSEKLVEYLRDLLAEYKSQVATLELRIIQLGGSF